MSLKDSILEAIESEHELELKSPSLLERIETLAIDIEEWYESEDAMGDYSSDSKTEDDFIDYYLEANDDYENVHTESKTSYCLRDVDSVNTLINESSNAPTYRICGRERQGISVGWGDSYYYTYAGQELDLTNIPSGTYRLRFVVNPKGLFEELSYDNNESYAVFKLDKEHDKVTVLETYGG